MRIRQGWEDSDSEVSIKESVMSLNPTVEGQKQPATGTSPNPPAATDSAHAGTNDSTNTNAYAGTTVGETVNAATIWESTLVGQLQNGILA